jgi:site-specific DNA-methyltransferase (adenine-specific)
MLNTIIHGDCLEVMPTMDEGIVDVVVLDPFFNDWHTYMDITLESLKREHVIILFSNRPHTGRLQVAFEKRFKFITEIVWNFADGRWVSNHLPRICHENILIFGNKKLNDARLLEWVDKPKPTKKGGAAIGKWVCANRYYTPQNMAQVESVIYLPRGTTDGIGIVSKPVKLMEILLQLCSNCGDVILDPFAGSGTTAIACINTGRNYIGIEKDENYYNIAKQRIAEHEQQLSII